MSRRHSGRWGEIEVMPLPERPDPPQPQGESGHALTLERLLDELFADQDEGMRLVDEVLLKTAPCPKTSSCYDEEKSFAMRELLEGAIEGSGFVTSHDGQQRKEKPFDGDLPPTSRPPGKKLPSRLGRSRR